jgi:hypothetical protein
MQAGPMPSSQRRIGVGTTPWRRQSRGIRHNARARRQVAAAPPVVLARPTLGQVALEQARTVPQPAPRGWRRAALEPGETPLQPAPQGRARVAPETARTALQAALPERVAGMAPVRRLRPEARQALVLADPRPAPEPPVLRPGARVLRREPEVLGMGQEAPRRVPPALRAVPGGRAAVPAPPRSRPGRPGPRRPRRLPRRGRPKPSE